MYTRIYFKNQKNKKNSRSVVYIPWTRIQIPAAIYSRKNLHLRCWKDSEYNPVSSIHTL